MSDIDAQRMRQKLAYIRQEISDALSVVGDDDQAPLADNHLMRSVKYSLVTAIEAVIDIAYHLNAKKLKRAPDDARDALNGLAGEGIISDSLRDRLVSMVRFRNLLVHQYEKVDDALIPVYVREGQADFHAFEAAVVRCLESDAKT